MMEGTAEGFAAPQYNNAAVGLASRNDANVDKTRYVFSIGDHISAQDKQGFRSIGGHFGGLWVGHSETEGCPTMKRTNFMLYRGAITPLETTAIPRKADHKELAGQREQMLTGEGVPPNIRGYMVYAGNDLNFLQNDNHRPMGIVELEALKYKTWQQSNAPQLQMLLFPRWNQWLSGVKAPTLLDEWMNELNDSFHRTPDLQIFSNDIYESNRLFRSFALGHIERNRQMIMAKRSVDNGGMFVGWSGISRLYAAQLGVVLEREDEIRPEGQVMSTGDPALIKELIASRQQTGQVLELLTQIVGDRAPIKEYAKEFEQPAVVGTVEFDPEAQDLSKFVSTGDKAPEISLTKKDEIPPNSNKKTKAKKDLETKLDDPNFVAALESDEGLRGAIKENPNLAGAIEDED